MLLRHLFIASVCAALGAAVSGCGRPSAGSVVAGDASPLRRGDLVERILLTGELDARKGEIIAVPPLPSWQTTIQWLADDGSALARGAKVVELDTSAVTSNLDDKRTTLREAEHKLAQQLASSAPLWPRRSSTSRSGETISRRRRSRRPFLPTSSPSARCRSAISN